MTLSNLPPGVTDRMIEEHANGPAPVDIFAEEQLEIARLRAEKAELMEDFDNNIVEIERLHAEIYRLQSLPRFWTVAVYLVDRAYGGPEEGGWYYDCGERQDTIDGVDHTVLLQVAFDEETAYRYAEMAQEKLDQTVNVGRPPISSVLSDGRYHAEVHRGYPPKHYPEETPHYE